MFGTYSDYLIPLLKILNNLPRRMGRGEDIIALFEKRYRKEIPDSAYLRAAKSGKMYWVQCVYNIQHKAAELGLVDNPSRGFWQLTEEGYKWLLDNPVATHYLGERNHKSHNTRVRRSAAPKTNQSPLKKETLPADQPRFRILNREIENLQNYLAGHNSLQPSDEKLCDWVHFCYIFEMYAEGKELFSLVSENNVNSWYYERTKKIVKVCEQKMRLA